MNTEAAILKNLFPPAGAIPLACIDRIDKIRAHIQAAIELAEGQPSLGRVSDPVSSEALTMQIVALRESPEGAGLCWREIGPRCGVTADAASKRYQKFCKAREAAELRREGYEAISGQAVRAGTYTTPANVSEKINSGDHFQESPEMVTGNGDHVDDANKLIDREEQENETVAAPPALQEAPAEHAENATLRESRIVEENEKVPETRGRKNPKIPHTEDEYICERRAAGARYSAIEADLQERGIDYNVDDVIARHHSLLKGKERKAAGKKDHNEPTPKEAGKATQEAPAPTEQASTESKPMPKGISRAELDAKTWELHKAGKTPEQISDELCSEGYYYGRDRVRRMLIQQGAEL